MKNTFRLLSPFVLILFACIIFFAGCIKAGGKCEMALNVRDAAISFTFKDNATGKYLYPRSNAIYNIDSLKIFDESNNNYTIFKGLSSTHDNPEIYWNISIAGIYNQQTDANAFNGEVCKKFIIKYTYNEIDTIRACFKAKETKCGSQFEYLNVVYKGVLIGSVTNTIGIVLIINK